MTNPTPITEECLREIEALLAKQTPRPSIALFNAFPDLAAALREAWTENERLKSSRDLAYGLLWGMSIDRRCKSDDLAARARETLLSTMNKSDQSAGITAARAALNPKGDGK